MPERWPELCPDDAGTRSLGQLETGCHGRLASRGEPQERERIRVVTGWYLGFPVPTRKKGLFHVPIWQLSTVTSGWDWGKHFFVSGCFCLFRVLGSFCLRNGVGLSNPR